MGRAAAFFDVDHTVLTVNSGTEWVRHLRRTGQLPLHHLLRSVGWLVQYKAGMLDFDAMAVRAILPYVGRSVDDVRREVRTWYEAHVRPKISRHARAAIERHRSQGDRVVLLTSATRFVSEPLAADLGVSDILCTEIHIRDGKITGEVERPACYRVGKVRKAEAFAETYGIDLDESWFYSDSYTDLPMLERVGHPMVVNPDPRLLRVARRRNWPILTWDEPIRRGA